MTDFIKNIHKLEFDEDVDPIFNPNTCRDCVNHKGFCSYNGELMNDFDPACDEYEEVE